MSKKNYTNYSKPKTVEVEPAVEETNVEEIKEETVIETEDKVENAVITGKVVDCNKLRVRESASTDADVICEITAGAEVTIDEVNSTNDFYKVCTAAGAEGFCMKNFIEIIR